MMKGIVRQGDKTTHGGTVLEGIPNFRIHGLPAAAVGHMVSCPLCNGVFPIIEGDTGFTAHGKAIALHGMRTACGAQLISSTAGFANVEHPRSSAVFASTHNKDGLLRVPASPHDANRFDDLYVLLDSKTQAPLANTEYALVRETGEPEFGTTDNKGRTHLLASEARARNVQIYVEG
ncbi:MULTISPECIES: PAAR domain-containing protein [Cupriavidus]|uniref:PAAR domain-containing protein n=1 Tax=Cupriavidus TaxID=106589 RepID=UPI0018D2FAC5|nr:MULTISPECIES: PAAR domain-containing protein [Cupriavidus]